MSRAPIVAIGLVLLLPATAPAGYDPNLHVDPSLKDCSVRFAPELTQDAFRRFAREFGSVSAFKQGAPPTTLGQWGLAVDVEQMSFSSATTCRSRSRCGARTRRRCTSRNEHARAQRGRVDRAAGFEVRYWHVAFGVEAQVSALTSHQARVSAVF